MNKICLSLIIVVLVIGFSWWTFWPQTTKLSAPQTAKPQMSYQYTMPYDDQDIRQWINKEAPQLQTAVVDKIRDTLHCTKQKDPQAQSILTIIDYSLPSNQKRLWVFDLKQHRLLFHTYVSHGLRSGEKFTTFFSNTYNSKASSMGVYLTLKNYLGREGSSLRLKGLESGFNDNAEGRSIVMHGAFYTEENFIKKYGRAGRSWGCPALPASQSKHIIDVIKDNHLLVIYYPSESWLKRSKYLSCQNYTTIPNLHVSLLDPTLPKNYQEHREEVLFVNHHRHFGGETPPILAVSAEYYQQYIHPQVPLNRMLRRQIEHQEYIALSKHELIKLAKQDKPQDLSHLYFIVPTLKMNHGYVQTVMKPVHFGKIINIQTSPNLQIQTQDHGAISLKPYTQFIRWLGL